MWPRAAATMVWIGHVESVRSSMRSMPFKLEQKRPNSQRLELGPVASRSVRVFNGAQGWTLRTVHGRQSVQPYGAEELRFAQAGHGIDFPLIDRQADGSAVKLEGVEKVEGRDAYRLSVRTQQGGQEEVWIDTQTFLDVRYDRVAEGASSRRVSVGYGDYRTVRGLQIPFLITGGEEPGAAPDRMRIEKVVLDAPLGAATFEPPSASHARSRAQPSLAPEPATPLAQSGQQGVDPP